MCTHCQTDDILEVEWLEKGDDVACEWIDDDEIEDDLTEPEFEGDVPMCGESAKLVITMQNVDDHLCKAHVAALTAQLGEGLSDMLEEIGLQDDAEFLPIPDGEEEACGECGVRATHAQLVTYRQYYCAAHAKEAGATLPPKA